MGSAKNISYLEIMEYYTLWFIIFAIVLVIKAAIGICLCIRRRERLRQIRERSAGNSNYQNWSSNNRVYVVPPGLNQQQQQQQQHWNHQQQNYGYSDQGWVNHQPQQPPNWTPSAPQTDLPPSYTDAVN